MHTITYVAMVFTSATKQIALVGGLHAGKRSSIRGVMVRGVNTGVCIVQTATGSKAYKWSAVAQW